MLFRPAAETVEEIAAGIAKTSKHRSLEQQAEALRAEWGRLHDLQRSTIAENISALNKHGAMAVERQLRQIEAQLKATQEQRREIGVALRPFREAHGSRLAAALRPRQHQLANEALDALHSLADIWQELEQLTTLVEREGGSLGRCPPLGLYLIERELSRLAGE